MIVIRLKAGSNRVQNRFKRCSNRIQSRFKRCSNRIQSRFKRCSNRIQSRFNAVQTEFKAGSNGVQRCPWCAPGCAPKSCKPIKSRAFNGERERLPATRFPLSDERRTSSEAEGLLAPDPSLRTVGISPAPTRRPHLPPVSGSAVCTSTSQSPSDPPPVSGPSRPTHTLKSIFSLTPVDFLPQGFHPLGDIGQLSGGQEHSGGTQRQLRA